MPAGDDATVPDPESVTVSTCVIGTNVAVMLRVALMATAQVGVLPLQPAPLQLENLNPLLAVAVRLTVTPSLNTAVHSDGQLIPLGAEPTVPVPVMETASSRCVLASWLKVAVTATSLASVTAQVVLLPQSTPVPLQPVNV
jgi:hypothetical protein